MRSLTLITGLRTLKELYSFGNRLLGGHLVWVRFSAQKKSASDLAHTNIADLQELVFIWNVTYWGMTVPRHHQCWHKLGCWPAQCCSWCLCLGWTCTVMKNTLKSLILSTTMQTCGVYLVVCIPECDGSCITNGSWLVLLGDQPHLSLLPQLWHAHMCLIVDQHKCTHHQWPDLVPELN